jgi:hypothetical protein
MVWESLMNRRVQLADISKNLIIQNSHGDKLRCHWVDKFKEDTEKKNCSMDEFNEWEVMVGQG